MKLYAIAYYVFIFFVSCTALNYNPSLQEGMYLTPQFNHIESLCKEIENDLDVLLFAQATPSIFDDHNFFYSDHLLNKLLCIHRSICLLLENEDENKAFLPEDIYYLVDTIKNLDLRLQQVFTAPEETLNISPHTILRNSQEQLYTLLTFNQEVITKYEKF